MGSGFDIVQRRRNARPAFHCFSRRQPRVHVEGRLRLADEDAGADGAGPAPDRRFDG